MPVTEFKTESKRILDLMVNSIYTHKEIFLRELISNASDAIDKLYFRSLTDESVGMKREDFAIELAADSEQRTLTVSDNGCGMTKDELADNLGTIAHSGTLNFKHENDISGDDMDVIGQFGVGFYAAFMVSRRVEVKSRAFGSDEAWCWSSDGADGYTIEPCEKEGVGTTITLYIKDDTEEEKYSEFLDQWRIASIVRKYSDYIRYPVKMAMEHSHPKEGTDGKEWESHTEIETLNSMIPLWRRDKSELTAEDYDQFYMEKFGDYAKPARVIHTKVEGTVSFTALLYIPSQSPYDFYTKEYEKGLQLYTNGVLIMDKCSDLIPDCFAFVRGLVDSPDVSLNISREMLQHDRQLKVIEKNIERRIKNDLLKMMADERDKYVEFWKSFGLQIKYGVYRDFGANKDQLKDLLIFHSLKENKYVSLDEYTAGMAEDQKYIYYACGDSPAKIAMSPQIEAVREKGYDVICLTDDVDEFAVRMLSSYNEKEFRSVSDEDLGIESEEDKKAVTDKENESRLTLDFIKDALSGKVSGVRLSPRLKTHPVCLTAEGEISLEMEKVFEAMPMENKVKAKRVLEINPDHRIFGVLCSLYDTDKDKLTKYAKLLYDQALMIEGMPVDDPVEFADAVCSLMN